MRHFQSGLLGLVLLSGCAMQPALPPVALDPALPLQIELRQVPFFAQEDYQCGPAALAMTINYYGQHLTPAALKPQVYLPGKLGSLQIEMQAAARRQGFLAYPLAPHLNTLLTEVAAGHPVIVLLNLGLAWYPVWHYAVVIGYDRDKDLILLRHGRNQRDAVSSATFQHTWARSNNWGIVILPSDRLPKTAQVASLIAADMALEKSGPAEAAWQAWQAALKKWPDNLTAAIGLGNLTYRQGKLAQAASIFSEAARRHPKSDVAMNNLAQVLSDQGRYREAIAAASQSVRLNGPYQAIAKQTLAEIRAVAAGKRPKGIRNDRADQL